MTKRKDTKFKAKLSNIADRRLHHICIINSPYTWSWQSNTMLSPAEAEQLRQYCLKLELQGRIMGNWYVDEPCASYGFEQLSESLMAALPLIPAQPKARAKTKARAEKRWCSQCDYKGPCTTCPECVRPTIL